MDTQQRQEERQLLRPAVRPERAAGTSGTDDALM